MKPLLVVIDMQRDFITGTLAPLRPKPLSLPCAKEYRPFQGTLFIPVTPMTKTISPPKKASIFVVHCLRGTPGWEILPEVLAAGAGKTAAVLDKPTFASTALVDFAASGGYDAIELVGVCTDICVISNALCLKSRLWEVPISVRASCCAGSTPEHHANALSVMESCQIDLLYEEQH